MITPVYYDQADIDQHYRDIVFQVGNDWLRSDEELAKFLAVCMDCRRGPLALISQNDVRARLLVDTVKGPRCSIEHHLYSALWSRAVAAGFIEKAKRHDGKTLKDETSNSPTGNNGKDQTVYRWTGSP